MGMRAPRRGTIAQTAYRTWRHWSARYASAVVTAALALPRNQAVLEALAATAETAMAISRRRWTRTRSPCGAVAAMAHTEANPAVLVAPPAALRLLHGKPLPPPSALRRGPCSDHGPPRPAPRLSSSRAPLPPRPLRLSGASGASRSAAPASTPASAAVASPSREDERKGEW
ncbi:hypothetical protein ACP70R_001933 [Stipagrostis hirtigluma subsp. patula]